MGCAPRFRASEKRVSALAKSPSACHVHAEQPLQAATSQGVVKKSGFPARNAGHCSLPSEQAKFVYMKIPLKAGHAHQDRRHPGVAATSALAIRRSQYSAVVAFGQSLRKKGVFASFLLGVASGTRLGVLAGVGPTSLR
eukprot:1183073-Prorocentrum_minimum.AAC.5